MDKYAHDEPAIYFLGWYREDRGYEIRYIGQTASLNRRLNRWKNESWWNCFTWERGSRSEQRRKSRETELIEKFQPPKNDRVSVKRKKRKKPYLLDFSNIDLKL